MQTITIHHLENTKDEFTVSQNKESVTLPICYDLYIKEIQKPFMEGLRWYLEKFLDYPYEPETDRAEYVKAALKNWGQDVFSKLNLEEHIDSDYQNLKLQIQSNKPLILSLPWEALTDQAGKCLGHFCHIERRAGKISNSLSIVKKLPNDQINILMVTARPEGEDIGRIHFRASSRPLLELIEKLDLPVNMQILRPPTFDELETHLAEHPNFYHILHFDGHGAYTDELEGHKDFENFEGKIGVLAFENDDCKSKYIHAERLGQTLQEYQIPVVLLDACQTAMIDKNSAHPFASVAAALVNNGIPNVLATSFSIKVDASREFFPAFYEKLFESGSIDQAVIAGRSQMINQPERVCSRGRFALEDWLVPVLYSQNPTDFSFVKSAKSEDKIKISLPKEVLQALSRQHSLIGRDDELLDLERFLRTEAPAAVISGLGGVGKTTLAAGFLKWLSDTQGLFHEPFWFAFQGIQSTEYVFNRMGEKLISSDFPTFSTDQKIEKLTEKLKQSQYIIVWDNFESVQGVEGTSVNAKLSEKDQQFLKQFLQKLNGGLSKVIITSRSPEKWLENQVEQGGLRGLDGDERWEFCETILKELGLTINQEDPDLKKLMDMLHGHPLSMRVILPKLEKMSVKDVISQIGEVSLNDSNDENELQNRLYNILAFIEKGLPENMKPLLIPLGMHQDFVMKSYFENIVEQVDFEQAKNVSNFFKILSQAGLIFELPEAKTCFELHPNLTGFIRNRVFKGISSEIFDKLIKAFVHVIGSLAEDLALKELYEQRAWFDLYGSTFHYAWEQTECLGLLAYESVLVQVMGLFTLNSHDFNTAKGWYQKLAELAKRSGNKEIEAMAYHQLGVIAQAQRECAIVEKWNRKSLRINKKHGNDCDVAGNYHQLGWIAEEQRDFKKAEKWCRKSIKLLENQDDKDGAATAYHQMGIILQEQKDFEKAEEWYHKALKTYEKQGNQHNVAMTYHQLGKNAQEQRDLKKAEKWYRKSIKLSENQSDEDGAAITYHQMGIFSQEQRDFDKAEEWYHKALKISEKQGDENLAAQTYHQLGRTTQEQRDFESAEKWFLKSLKIKEKRSNKHGAALTYNQMGIILAEKRDFESAEKWFLKSLKIHKNQGNEHGVALAYHSLGHIEQEQRNFKMAEKWYHKSLKIKEKQNDEYGAALTYHNLGNIEQEQRNFESAEKWYLKALKVSEKQGDKHSSAITYLNLGKLSGLQEKYDEFGKWCIKALIIFNKKNDPHYTKMAENHFMIIYGIANLETQQRMKEMWENEIGAWPLSEL
ncbi:Tetratricopeptide repeat protein [Candidatus Magnetomoraceae bacterium gMMP-15]